MDSTGQKFFDTPEGKFVLYREGWIDGASFHAVCHPDRPIYLDGYNDGREAVYIALRNARVRFDYKGTTTK